MAALALAPPELPSDMVFEILTRTALETLHTCKCVCKEWKQIIHAPDFMPTYYERTKNVSGFFIQSLNTELETLSTFVSGPDQSVAGGSSVGSLPRGVRILASCNRAGLLCCVRSRGCRHYYYVGKPTTEQWLVLPKREKTLFEPEAIGMAVLGSRPLKYKIVCVTWIGTARSGERHVYRCEEFNSESWAWQKTRTVNLPRSVRILYHTPCIFVHSTFHWLTNDNAILAYNIDKKSFHRLSLPGIVCNNFTSYLVEYQGELGVSYLARAGSIQHWVMEGKGTIYWRKVMVFNISHLKGDDEDCHLPSGFYNANIMLLKGRDEVVFYNTRDCTFRTVKLGEEALHIWRAFQFRSDWKPVNLRSRIF